LKSVEEKGLELISDVNEVPAVVTSLEYILLGNKRFPSNSNQKRSYLVTDKAIEDETLLAVKNFLNERFKSLVEIFPS
jgi:hypothetical protein